MYLKRCQNLICQLLSNILVSRLPMLIGTKNSNANKLFSLCIMPVCFSLFIECTSSPIHDEAGHTCPRWNSIFWPPWQRVTSVLPFSHYCTFFYFERRIKNIFLVNFSCFDIPKMFTVCKQEEIMRYLIVMVLQQRCCNHLSCRL